MALAIRNNTAQNRWISYTVNGQSKRAFFKAFEERLIEEIDSIDQLNDKRSKSLDDIIQRNPNSLQSGILQKTSGYIKDTSQEDRFEGFVSSLNEKFVNMFLRENNTAAKINVFRTSTDSITSVGTQFFDRVTKKVVNLNGYYSLDAEYVVNLRSGKVNKAFDLRPSITKPRLARSIYTLLASEGLTTISQGQIGIALLNASYSGSTGTTGTTTIVTGDTGTTWVTGTTSGVTSGTTTGTTGTTETITGSTGNSCYTSSDLLSFLSCYGAPTSGVTSGCSIWDFNGNGVIDSGDLLTVLANFCTSGAT